MSERGASGVLSAGLVRRALVCAAMSLSLFAAPPGRAAITLDFDDGFLIDDLTSNEFVDPSDTVDVTYVGGAVQVASPPGAAALVTKALTPASFSRWKTVYFNFSGTSVPTVVFDNGITQTPLTVVPSDDPAWSRRALIPLSVNPAGVSPSAALRFGLSDSGSGPVRTALDGYKLTFEPESQLRLAYAATAEVCSGATVLHSIDLSVSHVKARKVQVVSPLAVGFNFDLSSEEPRLTVRQVNAVQGATQYGSTGPYPLTLPSGFIVPPWHVYWEFDAIAAGTTLKLQYTTDIPVGTLDNTYWTLQANATSQNAAARDAYADTTSKAAPGPVIRKTISGVGVYDINGKARTTAGTNGLTYTLTVSNPVGSNCGETLHEVVVTDDISGTVVGGNPGLTVVPGSISNAGVQTGNVIRWELGSLPPGAYRQLTFRIDVAAGLAYDTVLTNAAEVHSELVAQPESDETTHDLYIGLDYRPYGSFGKGQRIRGSASITANNDDLPGHTVTYGESFDYLLTAANQGFSQLEKTVILDRIPADVTFSSASIAWSVGALAPADQPTIWYNTTDSPTAPDLDGSFDPLTETIGAGLLGTSWTSTAPSNPGLVKWVAIEIPRLASPFVPSGVPSWLTASVNVTVNPPSGGNCDTSEFDNVASFRNYVYVDGTRKLSTLALNDELERTRVQAIIPVLGASAYASPSEVIGANPFEYVITVTNSSSTVTAVDTAHDLVVELTLPEVSVNGVDGTLPVTSVQGGAGSTVDFDDLASDRIVRVTYPSLGPGASREIRLGVSVPRGLLFNTALPLAVAVQGQDDLCGEYRTSTTTEATATVTPYLRVIKDTGLEVAAIGSVFSYDLSYRNTGDGSATGALVCDRVPEYVRLISVEPDGGPPMRVFFSADQGTNLPATLFGADFEAAEIAVSPLWQEVTESGGSFLAPFGSATRWMCALVDNPNLVPPQLPASGQLYTMSLEVEVLSSPANDLIYNQALVDANELLPAVSNVVDTIISGDPSLVPSRECEPGLAASGETLTITSSWTNKSTNDDEDAEVTETLDPAVDLTSFTISWQLPDGISGTSNWANLARPGITTNAATKSFTFDIVMLLGRELRTGEALELEMSFEVDGLWTGDVTTFDAVGTATSLASSIVVQASCAIAISNPDLVVRKVADMHDPVNGSAPGFMLEIANIGGHESGDFEVVDDLPSVLTYTGPTVVMTPGWTVDTDTSVAGVIRFHNFRYDNGNGVGLPGFASVRLSYRTQVAGAAAGTTHHNCATVGQVGADLYDEDDPPDNEPPGPGAPAEDTSDNVDCDVLRVPHPDLAVRKTGPATAISGDVVTYVVSYANDSRQTAPGVVLFDDLSTTVLPANEADFTILSYNAYMGEGVYFASAATRPVFDPAAPELSGDWSATPSGDVRWIAISAGDLPGFTPQRNVTFTMALRAPVSGTLPLAGNTLSNCVEGVYIPSVADQDNGYNNRRQCVSTRVPNLDIALTKSCGGPCDGETCTDPYAELRPGDEVRVVLEVANVGTERAVGIELTDAMPHGFEAIADSAGLVVVTGPNGETSSVVDSTGAAIAAVPWTRIGDTWLLGDNTSGSERYHESVGLAAGDRTTIIVYGRIAVDVANLTTITNDAIVLANAPGQQADEALANNSDDCAFTVRRPDLFVRKHAATITGGEGPVSAGDAIHYTIEVENNGDARADAAVLSDLVPPGTMLVPSSFSSMFENATLVFKDAGGNVVVPTVPDGQPDPSIASFEVHVAPATAPLGAGYVEDQQFDGTFDLSYQTAGRVYASDPTYSTYQTPNVAPADKTLLRWRVAKVTTDGVENEGGGGITFDVLDTNGSPIPGYEGMPVNVPVDLSAIEVAEHGDIALQVNFGDMTDSNQTALTTLDPPSLPSRMLGLVGDRAYGTYDLLDDAGHSHPMVWENQGGGPGDWTPIALPIPGGAMGTGTQIWAFDGETLIASMNNENYYPQLYAWKRGGDGTWIGHAVFDESDGELNSVLDVAICKGPLCSRICTVPEVPCVIAAVQGYGNVYGNYSHFVVATQGADFAASPVQDLADPTASDPYGCASERVNGNGLAYVTCEEQFNGDTQARGRTLVYGPGAAGTMVARTLYVSDLYTKAPFASPDDRWGRAMTDDNILLEQRYRDDAGVLFTAPDYDRFATYQLGANFDPDDTAPIQATITTMAWPGIPTGYDLVDHGYFLGSANQLIVPDPTQGSGYAILTPGIPSGGYTEVFPFRVSPDGLFVGSVRNSVSTFEPAVWRQSGTNPVTYAPEVVSTRESLIYGIGAAEAMWATEYETYVLLGFVPDGGGGWEVGELAGNNAQVEGVNADYFVGSYQLNSGNQGAAVWSTSDIDPSFAADFYPIPSAPSAAGAVLGGNHQSPIGASSSSSGQNLPTRWGAPTRLPTRFDAAADPDENFVFHSRTESNDVVVSLSYEQGEGAQYTKAAVLARNHFEVLWDPHDGDNSGLYEKVWEEQFVRGWSGEPDGGFDLIWDFDPSDADIHYAFVPERDDTVGVGNVLASGWPYLAGYVAIGESSFPAVFVGGYGSLDDYATVLLATPGEGAVTDVLGDRLVGWTHDGTTYRTVVWTLLPGADPTNASSWLDTVIGEPSTTEGGRAFFVGGEPAGRIVHTFAEANTSVVYHPAAFGQYVQQGLSALEMSRDARPYHDGDLLGAAYVDGQEKPVVFTWDGEEYAATDLVPSNEYELTYEDFSPVPYYLANGLFLTVRSDDYDPQPYLIARDAVEGWGATMFGDSAFVPRFELGASVTGNGTVHMYFLDINWDSTSGVKMTPLGSSYPHWGGTLINYASETVVDYYSDEIQYPLATALGGSCYALNLPGAGPVLVDCSNAASVDRIEVSFLTVENPTIEYDVVAGSLCQNTITNHADFSTTTPEIRTDNNRGTAVIGYATADLAATIDVDKQVVDTLNGTDKTLTWTVTVTNNGPSPADDAFAEVRLPEFLLEGVNAPTTVQVISLGDLAVGQSETRIFGPYEIDSQDAGLVLSASVDTTSADTDCNPEQDAASAFAVTGTSPEVSITKTGPATVRVGETITWTVTAENLGNMDATSVVVMDDGPDGLEDLGAPTTLTVGQSWPTTVSWVVDDCAYVGQEIVNAATISADQDLDASNNAAAATTLVLPPAAELAIDIVPSEAEVTPGATLTYTIHYRNVGTAPTGTFSIAGSLPTGTVPFYPLSPIWNVGSLLPGQAGSVSYTVGTDTLTETFQATATALPMAGAICETSATSVVTTRLTPTVDPSGVKIVKSADTQTVCDDGTIRWTLEVSKQDWATAGAVSVTDVIPAGLSYIDGTITGRGADDDDPNTLAWDLGVMQPGTYATLSYVTTIPGGANGFVTNTAEARSGGTVVAISNPADIRVTCDGNLALTTALTTSCTAAMPYVATVTYRNTGTTTLTNVDLSLELGNWFTHVQYGGELGTYSPGTQTYDLELATLAPGATGSYTLRFTVPGGFPGDTLVLRAKGAADGGVLETSNQVAFTLLACDDQDPCTADSCVDGSCVNTPIEPCGQVECDEDSDCTDDDTNVCTVAACEAGSCVMVAGNAGTECRGSAGDCDVAETCTGGSVDCPADGFVDSGTECRGSAGDCDVAEACTGSSAVCPDDVLVTGGTECRASAGVCDVAEACTGNSVDCPTDAFLGLATECRAATGICDVAESCDGEGADCPTDQFVAPATECRASAGDCDVPEECTGGSGACPDDIFVGLGTECRASAGICDVAEACTGNSAACPGDVFEPSSTECRESAGICDVAETCTGNTAACPDDAFEPSSTECRESAGICDVAETCTGNTAACPDDGFAPSSTECRESAGICDVAETCTGNGAACPDDGFAPSSTECRESAGICDVAETCTGNTAACPDDGFAPSSTECRESAGICDVAETCTGNGAACPADVFEPSSTECRESAGICDVAETCTGNTAACPDDGFAPSSTECRESDGVCDVAETCTGNTAACPDDGFAPSSTECRESAGICDVAESCTGNTALCPDDAFQPSSTECREAADVCDVAELCTGNTAACPDDVFEPSSTECREAADVCDVAELCTGNTAACPDDVFEPSSTECREAADVCDVAELCTGNTAACPDDVLAPSSTECRESAGVCDVAELCTGNTVACPDDVFAPSSTECREAADICDVAELCTGNTAACPDDVLQAIDDGVDCTIDACVEGGGVTHTADADLCDDNNPCTIDTCDPVEGCDNAPFVSTEVSCGPGACESLVGQTTCDPLTGDISDNCDELVPEETIEVCNGVDDNCDGTIDEYFDADCGLGAVYYGIVEDEDGVAVGTIRCWVNATTIECERDEDDPDELMVFPALLCPGPWPVSE